MSSIRRPLASLATACSLVVSIASLGVLAACGGDGSEAAAPSAAPPASGDGPGDTSPATPPGESPEPTGIRVWFRLDTRLTTGQYLGERWVSPPTYQAALQSGSRFTAEARVSGTPDPSAATWTASEPDMVLASPERGSDVVITVQRAGRTTLTVSDGSTSTRLTVVAVHEGGAWQVEFAR